MTRQVNLTFFDGILRQITHKTNDNYLVYFEKDELILERKQKKHFSERLKTDAFQRVFYALHY